MDIDTQIKKQPETTYKSKLTVLFFLAFFFSVNMALTSYINSSFLEQFISPKIVGLIYMLGSTLTLVILLKMPKLLTKIGNYRFILSLVGLSIVSLTFFSLFNSAIWIILFFVIYTMTNSIIYVSLDEFLEYYSNPSKIGSIRGLYYSIQNTTWIISPFIAGILVETLGFKAPYTIALFAMIIMFLGVLMCFKNYHDPKYFRQVSISRLINDVMKNKGVFDSYKVSAILNFFYAWMIIYIPIYLHQIIGFNWSTIGLIFAFMLLPFLLLQFPLGYIADKYIGEKEIMIVGLVIMVISVASIGMLNSHNPIIWALLLFMTRVGASSTEIATETYFFKQITPADTGFLGFYRTSRPVSYIVGTLLASILLLIMPMKYIFFALALIICIGVYFASKIIDTK